MHLGIRESVALARGVLRGLRGKEETPDVLLCPSFTALAEVHKVVARSRVRLGAQNCGFDRSGAFTGEVSTHMLEDVGAEAVIVGHSERRTTFRETDEMVNKKMHAAAESKLAPILCVGESMETRDAGEAHAFVRAQLLAALAGVTFGRSASLYIAYEPIWAIGTGNPATVADVIDMHQTIRETARKLDVVPDDQLFVLYGGSVDGENAYQFLREREVDGLLVGGASLKLQQFHMILDAAGEVMHAQET